MLVSQNKLTLTKAAPKEDVTVEMYEAAYKLFNSEWKHEWKANPDSRFRGNYVVFSLFRDYWVEPFVFEAESLEKAFLYAFHYAKILPSNRSVYGSIRAVDPNKESELIYPDLFWSLQDKCWKSLKAVRAAEFAIEMEE